MTKIVIAALIAAALFMPQGVSAKTTAGIIGPTETLYWDSTQAFNGYTLFGARGVSYLVDMHGRLVHTWNGIGQNPRLLAYNGHILDASKSDPKGFTEMDWAGKIVWTYSEKRSDYAPHHDWIRIYNKKLKAYTTIYIANKTVPADSALAHGADPADGPYTGSQMDALVEVDSAGTVVWEWWFFNHVIQDLDAAKLDYVGSGKTIADYPDRININLPGRPLRKDWLHCNSLDYSPELGQLVTNSVQGEFYVIDHDNTFITGNPDSSKALAAGPAGDFLHRFGDPARYEQGDPPSVMEDWTKVTTGDKQIGGAHDIQWIDSGLTGAGHFLVFNNGEYLLEQTPQSYVFEINPFLDNSGKTGTTYINPPDAGYIKWDAPDRNQMKSTKNLSRQVTWLYYSKNSANFYSTIGSGAQRLPNGNTLICAMTSGHIIEVTSGGAGNGGSLNGDPAIVWEYICPITSDGIRDSLDDQYPMYNSIFRAYRYGADFAAFTGKDLTPGKTIAGRSIGGTSGVGKEYAPATAQARVKLDKRAAVATIYFPNPGRNARLSVFSLDGRLVLERTGITLENFVLPTCGMSPGVYVCRIAAANGVQEMRMRLVGR
jgi:hypothetical protein